VTSSEFLSDDPSDGLERADNKQIHRRFPIREYLPYSRHRQENEYWRAP